ncbi:MAG: class I SAM-dependent RNA methyltransferase [Fusobacteria bacterium]|nr:class I SAM-dependent RNA methyltransferase [Fusobacteriota bacterium]
MKLFNIVATTTIGLESCVKIELKNLGIENVRVENGYLEYEGTAETVIKSNIYLRCADRVYVKMGEFKAFTFDELFEGTKAIMWEELLPVTANFPISWVSSVKSKLLSKSDCQRIVKKAIVERLRNVYKVDEIPETHSKYAIKVQLEKDLATILIDTSGEALHKRGYRKKHLEAPLKETLAAGMIMLSSWRGDRFNFIDPMCGTGTIPIEAAMIAKNIAPGANRKFISEEWCSLKKELWLKVRDEAFSGEKESIIIKIFGSDSDKKAIEIAKENAIEAGVEECIIFEVKNFTELEKSDERNVIVTNPPYGERLMQDVEVEALYYQLGKCLKANHPESSWHIITSYEAFESAFSKKAEKNRKLYNGGLRCYLYHYQNSKKKL